MLEEADDPLEGEVAQREARDLAAPVGRSELQEETERVPVAALCIWRQVAVLNQMFEEETPYPWAQLFMLVHESPPGIVFEAQRCFCE